MPTVTTYNLEHKAVDLTPILNRLIAGAPNLISLFAVKENATATKCEWFQDQMKGRTFSGTPADTGIVTVTADEAAKVRLGMTVAIRDDSAVFRVTGVTPTQVTLSFIAANGSDIESLADLPTTATTFNIISEPIVEGSNDGEKMLHQPGKDYNFTQIFRKDVEFTETAKVIKTLDGSNSFATQEEYALSVLRREINRQAIFGIRSDDGNDMLRTFGGLYQFGTQTGGLSINRPGATLGSGIVNDAAQLLGDEGAEPNAIIVNSGQRRVLSNEYKNQLHVIREDKERGSFVGQILNDSNGSIMSIVGEPDIPDTHAWVVDTSGFGIRYLRPFLSTDATTKTMDAERKKIIGELTLQFKNAKGRLCLIKGLKPSQEALAAINAG